jgi:DNA-binding beta-propeller fold protein YncE
MAIPESRLTTNDASRVRARQFALLLGIVAIAGGWVLRSSVATGLQNGARARLLSVNPLPAFEGEYCEWIPASAGESLSASLREGAGQGSPQAGVPRGSGASSTATRAPIRVIRDSYPSYSSVAVDLKNNEVIMTDENLFQVLTYDRLANTPPSASMTEPKRIIKGEQTKIEFQCGLYIDPQSGDIYAVNNDTVDTLVIFSRDVRGDVPPTRELATPHGTFGIAVDERKQEMFLTAQHSSSVFVFHKMAKGRDDPIRFLQGNRTGLADPHGITLDTVNNLMYVVNHGNYRTLVEGDTTRPGQIGEPTRKVVPGSGQNRPSSITVYPIDAHGDTPPLRTIQGPRTQLNWPAGIAVDPARDELYVANDAADAILVFRASTADGDVAPIRTLGGPRSGIKNPTGIFLDTQHDELWVSNFGNHTATVYRPTSSGDSAPLRTIRSAPRGQPALMIGNPGAVAYDTKREQILVPN